MGTAIKTVDDIRVTLAEIKRFRRGQGLLGPEHYRCFGTGMRPCIMRSPYKGVPTFYLVGPELIIDQFKFQAAKDRLAERNKRFYREGNNDKRTVYIYTKRATAIEKFLELCQGVMDWNEEQAKAYQEAKKKAAEGDPTALMDF